MAEIVTYAKLIRDIGKASTEHSLKSWKKLADSDQYGYKNTGYLGVAYINHSSKELVIASSGTSIKLERGIEDLKKDLASDFEILKGKVPSQFSKAAWPFAKAIINNYLPEIKAGKYKLYLTGYSLGAVLAELTKVKLQFEQNIHAKAITFDSPGSLEVIHEMLNNHFIKKIVGITSYNSDENLINTCNRPAGDVYKVKIAQNDHEYYQINNDISEELDVNYIIKTYGYHVYNVVKHTFLQHDLDRIISALTNDRQTNKTVEKVSNWSMGTICPAVKGLELLYDLGEVISSNQFSSFTNFFEDFTTTLLGDAELIIDDC